MYLLMNTEDLERVCDKIRESEKFFGTSIMPSLAIHGFQGRTSVTGSEKALQIMRQTCKSMKVGYAETESEEYEINWVRGM